MKKKSLFLSTLISSCIVALSGQGSADITNPNYPTNRGDRYPASGQTQTAPGYGQTQYSQYPAQGQYPTQEPSGGPLYTPRGMCPGGQCPGGQCPGQYPGGYQPQGTCPGGRCPGQYYDSQGSGYQGSRFPESSEFFGSQLCYQDGGYGYTQSPQMYGDQRYGTQSRGTSRYQLPGYTYDDINAQPGCGYNVGPDRNVYGPQAQPYGFRRQPQYQYGYQYQPGQPYGRNGQAPYGGYGYDPSGTNGHGSKALQTSSTEQIKGTIQSINKVQYPDGTQTEIVVNTDEGTKKITLGPSNYVDMQRVKFQSGDKVVINAYRVGANGQAVYVAQDISRNGNTLQLRSDQRRPMWPEKPMNGNPQMQYMRGGMYH